MLKSLYSGVSGMKGFQTKLDVIGNNIANVNTVGFKKSRVMFQDIINQNIAGATGSTIQPGANDANERYGGVNGKQIGLGAQVGAIETLHTAGSPTATGVGSDLAINGDAYFVVTQKDDDPDDIHVDLAKSSKYLTKAGNFTLDGEGNLVDPGGNFVVGLTESNNVIIKIPSDQFTSYSIDANGYINVVNKAGESGYLAVDGDDGYTMKQVDNDGEIEDIEDVIALATTVVSNPGGLKKIGGSLFEETANSGIANLGRISENDGGTINSGVLEMSNVDLTDEFTELIIAQRGFQANSRTVTTSDSILEEVVNLKR